MPLTDTAIRTLKSRAKPYKVADEKGLYLMVTPAGGRSWNLKFRIPGGTEKKLSLGSYPEVSLKEARDRRDQARRDLANGLDPAKEKQRAKALRVQNVGNTFGAIGREYIDKRVADGHRPYAAATAVKAEWFLALLAQDLGSMPVTDIMPADVLVPLRKLEARGRRETAVKCFQFIGRVLRYAVATARLTSNPARDLQGALTTPTVKHHAAITDADELGGLLRAIDDYQGDLATKFALRFAPHVYQRPGEIRQMQWEEVDFTDAVWLIPAARMKMRVGHAVPLSKQAVAILGEAKAVTGVTQGYVFPSLRSRARPMSENTMNAALRRLGYSKEQMTSHGFRSTASSLLNESGLWSSDAIEKALAHSDKNAIRGIYNRSPYWAERVKMAQWWSDYLDELRDGTLL